MNFSRTLLTLSAGWPANEKHIASEIHRLTFRETR